MTRFNSRIGAYVLIGFAAIYMVVSLAAGKSATAEPPPDLLLKAADGGIDVMKAVGASIQGATIVDVRPVEEFRTYHIPGAVSAPGGGAQLLQRYAKNGPVIIVATKDDAAQKLTGEARSQDRSGKFFFLKSGVRDWYLTFELPVALFTDKEPPRGYADDLRTVKEFVATRAPSLRDPARHAVIDLAKLNYQPTFLGAATKAKGSGGPRKKISGGCGG